MNILIDLFELLEKNTKTPYKPLNIIYKVAYKLTIEYINLYFANYNIVYSKTSISLLPKFCIKSESIFLTTYCLVYGE